jgi:hypothetical protein
MNCVADELFRSHHSTCHWGKHETQARQTCPARGTFRLKGKLSTIWRPFRLGRLRWRRGGRLSTSPNPIVRHLARKRCTTLNRSILYMSRASVERRSERSRAEERISVASEILSTYGRTPDKQQFSPLRKEHRVCVQGGRKWRAKFRP